MNSRTPSRVRAGVLGRLASLVRPRATTSHNTSNATEIDRQMMTRAITLARLAAEGGEVPIGAVVYETSTGRVLAEAHNTREGDHDPTAHAELIAVREAARVLGDWRLNTCTVVVTLEPCPMCAGMLVNARVGRVVYGTDDPKAGACRSLFAITTDPRLNHRCDLITGVEAEVCSRLLKEFFKKRRRKRTAPTGRRTVAADETEPNRQSGTRGR